MQGKNRQAHLGVYRKALELRQDKRYAEALELFQQLLGNPDSFLSYKEWRHAYSHALTCSSRLHDWGRTETLARTAIENIPNHAEAYCRLGESMLRRQRFVEAEAALLKAIELNPASNEAPLLLELARSQAGETTRSKVSPWPSRAHFFENPQGVIQRFLLRSPKGAPIIEPDSVFMTFGSCFAQNLAQRLREKGRTVYAEEIGEDINSTYANRYLLDWVEGGVTDDATAAIQEAYGPAMRERMRGRIAESDVYVITLGVAACFFRKTDGKFAFIVSKAPTANQHLYSNHVMRTTTVDENVANIRAIMERVSRLAKRRPKFVLTVSPVPLGGTTERPSAVIADCVSKSTLRVAADQICCDPQGHEVVYWPSFEIVRWLGPHFGPAHPQVFGAEDGNSRHVSDWIIKLIIDMFLEHHSADTAPEAAEATG